MEAIGEQLAGIEGPARLPRAAAGNRLPRAHDAGSRLSPSSRTYAAPAPSGSGPSAAGEHGPSVVAGLDGIVGLLAAASLEARGSLATAGYVEAAAFAAQVENVARTVEYLQLLGAAAVDRSRTTAIAEAAAHTARTRRFWTTGWDTNGTETLTTPAEGTTPSADRPPPVTSPADDGCRNTAEFLRTRLRIPIREAHRRLTLALHTLPGTTLTGEPTPPRHEHLATALTPANTSTGAPAAPGTPPHQLTAPALSSHAATVITATLDRLQHHTSPETLDQIEHHLTAAAATDDPDFLARLAQRWTESIDADGTEPTEEALRHTQGVFIRKRRHALHHLEILASTDQYEQLLTAMNIATNPRTTTPNTTTNPWPATGPEAMAETPVEAAASAEDEDTTAGEPIGPDDIARRTVPVPDLERRTRAQQQLDGIITTIKTALTTNQLPTTGGNRPQIIATINHQDLFPARPHASTHSNHPGAAFTSPEPDATPYTATAPQNPRRPAAGAFVFTGPVAATTLRKIACDADIIPALLGTHGEILDLGRKTRLFSPAQRLALTARDQGCTFPNCTMPAPWCEAHHITYWSHGGATNTNNGALLCTYHHHLIHKETWTITITNNTPTFIPPPHIDPSQRPQQNHYFKPPDWTEVLANDRARPQLL